MTSRAPSVPSLPTPFTFPPSSSPRVWLITAASSPIGIAVAQAILGHGDSAVLGLPKPIDGIDIPGSVGNEESGRDTSTLLEGEEERNSAFRAFWAEVRASPSKDRCRVVGLDGRIVGQCQAAVAEAVTYLGRIDILFCCSSEALVGTVEELGASRRTQSLVREQIESNFFGPINCIKAALPAMRKQNSGHLLVLTGITGHLGTPGLGMYCASGWALEGFCDSLAYEVAPFNIKTTIVQPNLEINVLTNKITAAPVMPQYAPEKHPAPLCRGIINGLLEQIEGGDGGVKSNRKPSALMKDEISSLYPRLPDKMTIQLLAETLHAITAIGGHENPPARHIVGIEGVASVKEKLKTVSEELEDFVEISCAVDIDENGDTDSALDGEVDADVREHSRRDLCQNNSSEEISLSYGYEKK